MTVSICLPTRGRPARFREMYDSAMATATGDVEVVAVFDADDDSQREYPQGAVHVTDFEGRNQSDLWNVAWEHATGDIAHMGADDLVYRTPGWDSMVTQEFRRWRDRIGMVYVNDLNPVREEPFAGQRPQDAVEGKYPFSANPFVTREWIAALDGFFTPPFYKSWEADTWIYQLAESISRCSYLRQVVVEHMHPMAGKAAMDATYERGAWGNRSMMRAGWALTRSTKMRKLRRAQADALTGAIREARHHA